MQQDWYGLQVAAGGAGESQKGAIRIEADFAAKHRPHRLGEVTAGRRDDTHVLVIVITHDYRMQRVSDLPKNRLRSRLAAEGVESYHTCDTTVVYAYSNAPHNAAFYNSALVEAVEVVATGKAPAGCNGEFIVNKIRLAGSRKNGSVEVVAPSGHNVTQIADQADGGVATPLIKQDINHVYVVHDGCVPQFTGGNAQHGVQSLAMELTRRLGRTVTVEDIRLVAGHGKSPCDGAGKCPKCAVENGRLNKVGAVDTSGSGSRAVFVEAAFGLPEPTTSRVSSLSLQAHSHYVYAWYPDDGTGFGDYAANKPYDGISRDCWHAPHPGNTDPDDAHIVCRLRPCVCAPCLQGQHAGCLVPGLVPGNEPRTNQMVLARRVDAVHRTRQVAAQDHSKLLKTGVRVVVRVHADEDTDEPYFLATCVGRPYPLLADHASETNPLRRGRLVVKIRWLHHTPSLVARGYRTYTRVEGEDPVVWPVDCVVAELHHEAQEAAQRMFPTMLWRLPTSTHDYMVHYDHGAALLS